MGVYSGLPLLEMSSVGSVATTIQEDDKRQGQRAAEILAQL